MIRRSLAGAVALLALAACDGPDPQLAETPPTVTAEGAAAPALSETPAPPLDETASASGCAAEARATWMVGDRAFQVRAVTEGPDCAHAAVVLTVRTPEGELLLAEAHRTLDLFCLSSVKDLAMMERELARFIEPSGFSNSAELPDWPEFADWPHSDYFSFYPEELVDRDVWLELREAGHPLLCFLNHREHLVCHYLLEPGPSGHTELMNLDAPALFAGGVDTAVGARHP
jgi:hypothetical protein